MNPALADSRRWVRGGTALLTAMAGHAAPAVFGVDDWDAPSRLPGWTRRHLGAHLAANADALRNLVRWAETGEPCPMYASPEQRAADIERGARRPGPEIADWLVAASIELDAAMSALTDQQWARQVVTAQGRTVGAITVPWLRAREVYVHAVDFGTGLGFADLPVAFLHALIEDVCAKRSTQQDDSVIDLVADDGGRWRLPGTGDPVRVAGSAGELAAYLTGRGGPAGAPVLSPWL